MDFFEHHELCKLKNLQYLWVGGLTPKPRLRTPLHMSNISNLAWLKFEIKSFEFEDEATDRKVVGNFVGCCSNKPSERNRRLRRCMYAEKVMA